MSNKFPLKPYNNLSKAASKVGGPAILLLGTMCFGAIIEHGSSEIIKAIVKAKAKKVSLENGSKNKNRVSK